MTKLKNTTRRGTTIVESVFALSVSLTLILGMLDLSLAELQDNLLSEAARRLARAAALHGALGPPQVTAWGPTSIATNAGDGSAYAAIITPILATMTPANVQVSLAWPDGGNTLGQRVQVVLTYTHHSVIPLNIYGASLQLQAESTMLIQH
jgi:hypothetical protein